MPDVTQLSHGRPRLLGTPMFRDTLCSAFLSVNTNFCSSSLLHLDGAVPQDIQGLVGKRISMDTQLWHLLLLLPA